MQTPNKLEEIEAGLEGSGKKPGIKKIQKETHDDAENIDVV